MSRSHLPVVLLAFANARLDDEQYLRSLPEEHRRIRASLRLAESAGLCEVLDRDDATLSDILDDFQDSRYRGRIAIFHFGGHAGSGKLLFESPAGDSVPADAGGLAHFLGQQRGLELVFLNGCSTRDNVECLLDAGAGAVVATSQAIDDDIATDFAARFYKALASGATIAVSYSEAEGAVRASLGETKRATYRSFVPDIVAEEKWPWDLYVQPGAAERIERWSLPVAVKDPLYGLPSPPLVDLPPSPFKHLDWFTRDDASIFFGRGREIRDLWEAVTLPLGDPLILLYGPAGVGKSSLLDAGLRPRLESSHEVIYTRRRAQDGLAETLVRMFSEESNDLLAAWRLREASGKPIVAVLDQVEEVWTRPISGINEVDELRRLLSLVFGIRERRPIGRLILGFRKEWLAEVQDLLSSARLPFRRLPLEHLDREGIAEAVAGPASTQRLRDRYKLTVQSGLPAIIADDLLEDTASTRAGEDSSAIAPVLQILLTKMWELTNQQCPDSPRFSVELYQDLKRRGLLLEDFVEEQLVALRTWRADLVESGLTLDLLAHHTTPLGTAETRQATAVLARYGDRPEIWELLEHCRDRHLLSTTARSERGTLDARPSDGRVSGSTRLAHDTLGPLVRRRFETSDLPGQRAQRILAARTPDWSDGRHGAPLDERDLTAVERGLAGRAIPDEPESRLIEASRLARRRTERRKHVSQVAAATIAVLFLLGFIAVLKFWQQRRITENALRNAKTSRLIEQARSLVEEEHALAALLATEAVANSEGDVPREAEESIRAVLARASGVALADFGGDVGDVQVSDSGSWVIATGTDGDTRCEAVRAWKLAQRVPATPLLLTGTQDCSRPFLSPSGRWLLTLNNEGGSALWQLASDRPAAHRTKGLDIGRMSSPKYSPNSRWLIAQHSARSSGESSPARPRLFDLSSGEPLLVPGAPVLLEPAGSYAFSPTSQLLALARSNGSIDLIGLPGVDKRCSISASAPYAIQNLVFSPHGSYLAAVADDRVMVWSIADSSPECSRLVATSTLSPSAFDNPLFGEILFSPDESWLVLTSQFAGSRHSAKLLSLALPTKSLDIGRLDSNPAFSPDSQWLALARLGRAEIWSLVALRAGSNPTGAGVPLTGAENVVAFAPDSAMLLTGTGEGALWVWGYDDYVHSWRHISDLGGHDGEVVGLTVSKDGSRLISADDRGGIRAWDMSDLQPAVEPRVLQWASGPLLVDGRYCDRPPQTLNATEIDAALGHSREAYFGLRRFRTWAAHAKTQTRIVASKNGQWNITSPTPFVGQPSQPGTYLNTVAGKDNPRRSLSLCPNVPLFEWTLRSENKFSPDGREVVWKCDGLLSVLDLGGVLDGRPSHPLLIDFEVEAMEFSPDGAWFVAGGRRQGKRSAFLWARHAGEWWLKNQDVTPEGPPAGYPWRFSFSRGSQWLMVRAGDVHQLIALRPGAVAPERPRSDVVAFAFSSNDRWLGIVTKHAGKTGELGIRLRDLVPAGSELLLRTVRGDKTSSIAMNFSPKGRWLVTTSPERTGQLYGEATWAVEARLWNLDRPPRGTENGRELVVPGRAPWKGWLVAYSPDERLVAVAREDGEYVGLWDVNRHDAAVLLGIAPAPNRPGVRDLKFSPDGASLAVLADTTSLWRLGTDAGKVSEPRGIVLSHEVALGIENAHGSTKVLGRRRFGESIQFSSDGSRLITIGVEAAVVWRTSLGDLTAITPVAVGRNMRADEWTRFMGTSAYRKTFKGLPVDPTILQDMLRRVRQMASNGVTLQARSIYASLARWSVEAGDAQFCNAVAWSGGLDGAASEVMVAADFAVDRAPFASTFWDTRGVLRGLGGDLRGAAADLREFLKRSGTGVYSDAMVRRRLVWLSKLEKGTNPFDRELVSELKRENED